ncbi:MAG TPA: outer membrane beta-barrel protein [Kofleriaceae bacterium]|jgi:hypothetical protein
MKNVVFALLVPLALTSIAHAEEASNGLDTTKKATLSAGLFYGMPQGDFKKTGDQDLVGSSPGFVLSGGYEVMPRLSIMGLLHYYAVSSELDGVDQSMWDIGAGARYAYPVSPVLRVFGEAYVQRASYSAKAGGASMDSSGFGGLVGGGVLYAVKPQIDIGASLSYSTASLKPDQGDSQSAGWIGLTAFAAYHL